MIMQGAEWGWLYTIIVDAIFTHDYPVCFRKVEAQGAVVNPFTWFIIYGPSLYARSKTDIFEQLYQIFANIVAVSADTWTDGGMH